MLQKLLAKIHISTKVLQDLLTFIFETLKLNRLFIDDIKFTSWLLLTITFKKSNTQSYSHFVNADNVASWRHQNYPKDAIEN